VTSPVRPRIVDLPPNALRAVGRVRAMGIRKYPADDWRSISPQEHLDAAVGHILQSREGVRADPESGEHPLAHAALRVMMALERELEGVKTPTAAHSLADLKVDPGSLT